MMGKLLLYSWLLLLLLSGCVGFVSTDINKAMEIQWPSSIDTDEAFDESKVIYIKELRCYAYEEFKKSEMYSILFDAAGKKISTRGEAIEHVRLHYESNRFFSTSEKIAYYSTAAWAAPVGFVLGIAENVAMLPALPYLLHVKNKFEREAVEYYQSGQRLAEQGNYSEAREKYFAALSRGISLIYKSDINYQIADTYDKEGNTVLAEKYYRNFLEFSIALFPDYFQERDPKLTNDRAILDKEFTAAEAKLNKILTSRSSPAL